MYLNKVELKNIKSISSLKLEFKEPAGWHVIIGDNGSGKSSIIRAISLALIGPVDAVALRINFSEWVKKTENEANIKLEIAPHEVDIHSTIGSMNESLLKPFNAEIKLKINDVRLHNTSESASANNLWNGSNGWFSASFGPFRRFSGGDKEWEKVYNSSPRVAAHLSAFGESVALTECIQWLINLNYKALEESKESKEHKFLLGKFSEFINNSGLLPHDAKISRITSSGVFFEDGNKQEIDVSELSDGFRSLLSLTFELIRQLIQVYGVKRVFDDDDFIINIPGIVLIDEVDAHLHPSWQTRIGQWFLKYFPKIQFIVTTHSPLICRASEKGTIWRMASPGSNQKSLQVTGKERDKLIYGNILDAFGTEVFGKSVSRSNSGNEKMKRLAELNLKSIQGQLSEEEEPEYRELSNIFSSGK